MYALECIHCGKQVGRLEQPGQDDAAILRTHLRRCPGLGAGAIVGTRLMALLDHFRLAGDL